MSHHQSVSSSQIAELILQLTGHFIDHRTFQVNHLIVRQDQYIVFAKRIAKAEGQLILMILSEIRIGFHIFKEIMHPAHVPFVGKAQAVFLWRPGYLWKCCGFLGDHHGSRAAPG